MATGITCLGCGRYQPEPPVVSPCPECHGTSFTFAVAEEVLGVADDVAGSGTNAATGRIVDLFGTDDSHYYEEAVDLLATIVIGGVAGLATLLDSTSSSVVRIRSECQQAIRQGIDGRYFRAQFLDKTITTPPPSRFYR